MQRFAVVLLFLFSANGSVADSAKGIPPLCLSLDAKPDGGITIIIQGNPGDEKMRRLTSAIQAILGDSQARVALIDLNRWVCIPVN